GAADDDAAFVTLGLEKEVAGQLDLLGRRRRLVGLRSGGGLRLGDGGVGVAAGSQQRQAQDQQTAERVGRLHVIVTSEGPSVVLDSPPGPSYWAARRQCNAAAAGFRPG